MLPPEAYYLLLLITCALATARGGAPERITAAIILAASLLSTAVASPHSERYRHLEAGVFTVDVITLLALVVLALHAHRIWTLWLAAAQLVATAAHAVKLVDPTISRGAYAIAMAFWSYPMLLIILLGVRQHRTRLRREGYDRSWSA